MWVTSNGMSWDLGQNRPLRTFLSGARSCRIGRDGAITDITGLILDPGHTTTLAGENAYTQSLILLEPIGNADQALDACLPAGSDGRILLDQAAQTAPELHALALRIADHLDGLACTDSSGNIPMAGIVLHVAVSELLHYPHGDPLDRAAALYAGLWQAVGYHLVNVTITTPTGVWTSSTPQPLRAVLAGQTVDQRPARGERSSGHALLDRRSPTP